MKTISARQLEKDLEFDMLHSAYNFQIKQERREKLYKLCAATLCIVNLILFAIFAQFIF